MGALSILVVSISFLFFLYIFVIHGVKLILRRRLGMEVTRRACACLTFDDGPHDESTPLILDCLDRANVKATFFLVGRNAEALPELVERMIAAGHEVGEHGYSHYHAWKTNPVRLLLDLRRCARVFERFRGESPALFRPPHGKLSLMTWLYVLMYGRRLAFWNVDPKDYDQDLGSTVSSHVIERLGAGSVILLHDGAGNREGERGSFVCVEALDAILRAAALKNVRFAPLGEALGLHDNVTASV